MDTVGQLLGLSLIFKGALVLFTSEPISLKINKICHRADKKCEFTLIFSDLWIIVRVPCQCRAR
jgi:hypothetical protein